jgi:hypothetical protein
MKLHGYTRRCLTIGIPDTVGQGVALILAPCESLLAIQPQHSCRSTDVNMKVDNDKQNSWALPVRSRMVIPTCIPTNPNTFNSTSTIRAGHEAYYRSRIHLIVLVADEMCKYISKEIQLSFTFVFIRGQSTPHPNTSSECQLQEGHGAYRSSSQLIVLVADTSVLK